MNIKVGDKVRIKTLQEMIHFIGHMEFHKPEFFKRHGNERYIVMKIIEKSESKLPSVVTLNIEGRNYGISTNSIERVNSIDFPQKLFEI